ncbi:MAG: response regulator transcription factor [Sediminibacterium sp.]|jgi:two-component system alkaline phosphatase synthesis response regulator PhoP|nr:response regulator transcription factor [Sediminibacterium sp.]MBP6144204.1 response regulator transcription factor [Sediminibacterium sp.]MBP7939803.1 response regulator transcription factor [Sediminibacterium sp.]
MQKSSILLVEDEEHLHEALKLNLEMEGYEVDSAFDGQEALKQIQSAHYDLIILDIMLPSLDGFSITERLRLNNNQTPILILSAKNTSANRVQGLKLGADDYLTKPFNLEELLLRVNKLIQKRTQQGNSNTLLEHYQFQGHTIDFNASEALLASGQKITLTKRELLLLKLLIEHKHNVVTREKILQLVWGYQVFPNTRTIDNFILNFRKYFEMDPKHPKHFISMRGVGYKFQD